jgi:quercetin dioxygenase-like cupin family protein
MNTAPMPLPLPAPDVLDDELALLLHHLPAATAPEPAAPAGELDSAALRRRLFGRVQASARAARVMCTRRLADAPAVQPAPGVTLRTLYRARGSARRAGEPDRSALVELAAGACWPTPADGEGTQREWLVLRGEAQLGPLVLAAEDFHLLPAGAPCPPLASRRGALLLLREAPLAALPAEQAATQRATEARWAEYGPGVVRRVLWQRDGQAAMLYRTLPGAAVPRHVHHHDEECLMLAGELFLDDVLLRPLDYQLAPAGSEHGWVSTDTGVVLYAHGDLDLALRPD